MVSTLNFVRSWMSYNFIGRFRQSMSVFLRHCESTDMQVSRLHNLERCRPWDQLLKKGLTETHDLCVRMLSGETMEVSAITLDGYQLSICLQLQNWEKFFSSPRPRGKSAVKSSQRKSSLVSTNLITQRLAARLDQKRQGWPKVPSPKSRGRSRRKGVGSLFSPALRNRGRRTAGVPMKSRQRRIAVLDSLDTVRQ